MTSVLQSEYIEPIRPYSQNELNDLRFSLFKKIRLGKEKAYHKKCGHFYYVKENSKKEKEIKENSDNIGNCSVCWSLSKTQNNLKDKAYDLVGIYTKEFYSDPVNMTYDLYDLEDVFYRWLYSNTN
jgi:hypothetical protein